MSQSRVRKAPGGSEAGKNRASTVKASGDNAPCRPKEQNQRSKSKSKIPKSIRYELDNALIGLCDVWFEEIKPHLIRNNIKLHVDGSSGGTVASGDQSCLPAGAPGCSHLDPGAASDRYQPSNANSAGCCSTPPTVSRAPCRRPPAQPLRPDPRPQPPSSPPSRLTTLDLTFQNKPTTRQSHYSPSTLTPELYWNWRVPRRCQTHTSLTPTASPRTIARTIETILPRSATQTQENNVPYQMLRRQDKADKLSQTDPVPILSMFRHRSPVRQPKRNNVTVKISDAPVTTTQVDSRSKTSTPQYNIPPLCLTSSVRKHRPNVSQKRSMPSQRRTSNTRISQSRPSSPEDLYRQISSQKKPMLTKNRPVTSKDKPIASENRHTYPQDQHPSSQNKPKSPNINKPMQNKPIASQNLVKSLQNRPSSPQKKSKSLHPTLSPAQKSVNLLSTPMQPRLSSQKRSISPPMPGSCERCPATVTFYPHRSNKIETVSQNKKQEKRQKDVEDGEVPLVPQLFANELIDIIVDKNDKRLSLLYRSPEKIKSDSSTMLVLYSSPEEKQFEARVTKKTRPWR